MEESEFGRLARQGLNTHLEYVRRRTEILAMLDRISLVLREEFQIPDLELRFRADGGSGNRNEGSLRFVCMKTTKDRRQHCVDVVDFVLPSEQGEKGRLGDYDFETVEDFQQLLAEEMRRPRFGVLVKQLLDGCRFDVPKLPDSAPPDPIGNRNFIPPPTEDPDDGT